MDGGLGGGVGWRHREGNEGKAGGDGDDRGFGLGQKLRHQRMGQADRAEEVGGDGIFGDLERGLVGTEPLGLHDPGVQDHGGEVGVIFF
jgi:hypothetical protein